MEYISKQRAKDFMGCCLASAKANYKEETDVFKRAKFQCYVETIEAMIDVVGSVEAADVQPVDRWISVEDRTPDKDGDYLCYLECGMVCQSTFDSTMASEGKFPFGEWVGVYNSDTRDFTDRYWEEYDAITHWMPLPEPPKDGDAE